MGLKTVLGAVTAALVAAGAAMPASAFPEKNITFIIPYRAGGGFDFYVRAIIPYMEKYLPKKVNVIPKNLPGAGGRKGITASYRAKPNGYTIALHNIPGNAIAPLLGKKVKYDLNKVTWLAAVATDHYMLAVAGKSKIRTLADFLARAKRRPIKFTTTGAGSTGHAVINVVRYVMKIPSEVITGYKGTKGTTLGVVRGDGDSSVLPNTSTRKYVQSGDIRALVTTATTSPWPGVPTMKEAGYPELHGLSIVRVAGGPPGIPKAVAKTLETALMKAMADPGLLALTAKAKRPLTPMNAKQAKAEVDRQVAVYLKFREALSK